MLLYEEDYIVECLDANVDYLNAYAIIFRLIFCIVYGNWLMLAC